ncbi:hypothetical protein CEXT_403361 [Caerostris extrusa]|uniref:Uncharacterized protein n=1 Tax=Caerostris extrusa TaxID=172846 RepID=A0AAV4XQ61_CAEEX|nr:hypothetical protein CEXT_403361 [Caerostris extrusa]
MPDPKPTPDQMCLFLYLVGHGTTVKSAPHKDKRTHLSKTMSVTWSKTSLTMTGRSTLSGLRGKTADTCRLDLPVNCERFKTPAPNPVRQQGRV